MTENLSSKPSPYIPVYQILDGLETPAARSCEEPFDLIPVDLVTDFWICFSDPVKILEKQRGIFINIALKILNVWVKENYLTETSQSFSSFK